MISPRIGTNRYQFKFSARKYSYRSLTNNGTPHFGVHGCFYLHWYVNVGEMRKYHRISFFQEHDSSHNLPLIIPVILPSYGERASEALIEKLTKKYKATILLSEVRTFSLSIHVIIQFFSSFSTNQLNNHSSRCLNLLK